jgi:hypothetical protein
VTGNFKVIIVTAVTKITIIIKLIFVTMEACGFPTQTLPSAETLAGLHVKSPLLLSDVKNGLC